MRSIIWLAIVVVAMLLPEMSYAQIDAAALARSQRENRDDIYGNSTNQMGFGNNGMPIDEETEEEVQDSTKTKKKRERKPLESYYFSDAFGLAYRLCLLPRWCRRYGIRRFGSVIAAYKLV